MSHSIRNRVKELRHVPASELAANPLNWRTHPAGQQAAIRGILAEVGIAGALLAYETPDGLRLIDGHLRRDAAPDSEWPVLVLDVTEDEARKLLATVDPISAMAATDGDALARLLADVKIDDEALGKMLKDVQAAVPKPDVQVVEAGTPELPVEPVTQRGDLWTLGDHRLLCGDSTNADDVARVMGGEKADLCLTDPPYGVSYVGKTEDAMTIENDDMSEDELSALVVSAFDHAVTHCRPGAYWYATVPPGPLHLIFATDWKRRGILRQIMVWVKDSMVLGHSEYHYQHEPILFGWMPGPRHKNADRTRTTVWECERPKASREHPTMKPIALWARAIQDGSLAGEHVYDPFLGSGTTLIAAEQLGRKCYGIEISPAYCDVIVARWEKLTGKKAVRNG